MIVILCILGGLVSYILLTRQPSTKVSPVAEKVARVTPPPSPPVSTIQSINPKPTSSRRNRSQPKENQPHLPRKPLLLQKDPLPLSLRSPGQQEKPKPVEEEKRKGQTAERLEPETIPEKEAPVPKKEASVKAVEPRASSPFAELLSHGPQLLHENKHLRVLEQVQKLSGEERQNINIRILECFAHLKKIVLDKDKNSKQPWGQLYKSIENSRDQSATPLLIKIARDQEEYTRLYAITLLGNIGDQRAVNDLQQIANTDPNRKIRSGAAKAIALIQRRG